VVVGKENHRDEPVFFESMFDVAMYSVLISRMIKDKSKQAKDKIS
jgi:hypothetical protein